MVDINTLTTHYNSANERKEVPIMKKQYVAPKVLGSADVHPC